MVDFVRARLLRVLPALLVAVALTVFVVGPALTTWPLTGYLAHADTWRYMWRNATLVAGIGWSLPGLFESTPHADLVNGSLRTLTHEIRY